MMAAYAALVSLMQTIHEIEHHPFPPISLHKQQAESLTQIVTFLQEFLEGYNSPVADSNEADRMEMCIADAAYAAEDVIESNILDRILLARSEDGRNKMGFLNFFRSLKKQSKNDVMITSNGVELYEGLQKVIEEMDLIKKEAMQIVAVQDQLQRQVSSFASSSKSSSAGLNNAMVGVEDVINELLLKLIYGRLDRQAIPIVGMAGIGKTTIARNMYAHPLIKDRFDVCAWATISQLYNTREILYNLLSQVTKESSERLGKMREDEVGLALYKYLFGRRFLIVLDDMWSVEAWEIMQLYFPDNGNGSRIMVTTRLSNLGSQLDNNYCLEMKFLDDESSWNMFSEIVFGGESCPREFEKIGKEIVKSCRGLPLSIVVVGGLLEKMERTKECWKSIRRSLNSSVVNSENDEHCLKILKLSYNHLPVHLKPCFLYTGVFEEDSAIRVSTVVKLWVSDGFLKPISGKSLETIGEEYLKELIDRNLILVEEMGSSGGIKFIKIHDLLRDLCLREAEKERFYHVVGKHSGCSQRRIVIPRNTSKKLVGDAMESTPHARSCVSDCERVGVSPNLRLLRTLKAFEVGREGHMYPLRKVFKKVNLRFVAVKADDCQLPCSINLLWSLQTLIVSHPRENIDAPVEIWRMPQLRHVHFCDGALRLADPPRDSIFVMENLQTLKGVRNFKCDEEMVRRIPNIKKLRVTYHPDDKCDGDDYCVHNIERLQKLESLSCENKRRGGVFLQKLTFPHSLKSLILENVTDRMEDRMEDILEKISRLPLLEKLRLVYGSFVTNKWETVEGQFPSLKSLSLTRCLDLENWVMESSHFPCLEHLRLTRLTGLKEIPAEMGEIPTLKSIVLTYCSKAAVKSMKKIVEEQEALQGEELPFTVVVELLEGNQELQSLATPNFQVKIVPNYYWGVIMYAAGITIPHQFYESAP